MRIRIYTRKRMEEIEQKFEKYKMHITVKILCLMDQQSLLTIYTSYYNVKQKIY